MLVHLPHVPVFTTGDQGAAVTDALTTVGSPDHKGFLGPSVELNELNAVYPKQDIVPLLSPNMSNRIDRWSILPIGQGGSITCLRISACFIQLLAFSSIESVHIDIALVSATTKLNLVPAAVVARISLSTCCVILMLPINPSKHSFDSLIVVACAAYA